MLIFKLNFTKNRQGFTLFELLVAVVLLAIISTMIYSVLNVGIKFNDKGEKQLSAQAHEHGLLELLRRQINSARYDQRKNEMQIAVQNDILRIVTRQPLIYRAAGVVLAIYRFDDRHHTVYYTEKRDFYNVDYDEGYVPDQADMLALTKTAQPLSVVYDADEGVVFAQLDGKTFDFLPKCWPSTTDKKNLIEDNDG